MPLPPNYNTVLDADGIKRRRKRFKLTQTLFGRLLGVDSKTVSNWESGRGGITRSAARTIICLDFVPDHMLALPQRWRRELNVAGTESLRIAALFTLIQPLEFPVPQEN